MSDKMEFIARDVPDAITFKKYDNGTIFRDMEGYPLSKEETEDILNQLKEYLVLISGIDYTPIEKERLRNRFYEEERENFEHLNKYEKQNGIVYFLKRTDGLIKIGLTTNIKRRIRSLVSEFGQLEIIKLIESKDITATESIFHITFKRKRIVNEWFDLSEKDIDFIKSNNYPLYIQNIIEGNGFDKKLYLEEDILGDANE